MQKSKANIGLITLLLALFLSACGSNAQPAQVETEITSAQNQAEAEQSAQADAPSEEILDDSSPEPDQDSPSTASYTIVDTNQTACYDNANAVSCPENGQRYYGQDAQYQGNQPSYRDNDDGTITDLNTGLTWIQDAGAKVSYYDGISSAENFSFAGFDDWRVPTIKELYSLMDFSGIDDADAGTDPFIDRDYFVFEYGDTSAGERSIDSQWITSTIYVDDVMNNQECFFGVNFADGRIKCYPTQNIGNGYFLRLVRGDAYGLNEFADNSDGTITDLASGLTWQQSDSIDGMDWPDALNYCEALSLGASDDWRLPNAKELQSILDYSRSPDTTSSAAIDPIFDVAQITNEAGQADYAYYWSSTTHANRFGGNNAVYFAFGRALGDMGNGYIDVHGAGAQRSDPKTGDASDFPYTFGPQGDVARLYNVVRCVTDGVSAEIVVGGEVDQSSNSSAQPPQDSATTNSSDSGPAAISVPQEAVNACSGLSAGASCSVGPGSGTCTDLSGTLACVPEGGPPSDGPPPGN